MRVYIAGVQHESSSFSPIPTSMRSFERWDWTCDQPHAADGFGYGEACRLAELADMHVVAGPFFNAEPSSPAVASTWHEISEQILDGLRAASPVDIVLLCLHGAQMARRSTIVRARCSPTLAPSSGEVWRWGCCWICTPT